MTRHCDFMMEARPYGGHLTNFVGIKCGWCDYEEWHPAKNGGWAMRIFRARGWKVANKIAQHRCPTCFTRAKSARSIPDNPVIPADLGKRLKTTIMEAHVRDALLGTTSMNILPEVPPPVTVELSDQALARLHEKPEDAPVLVILTMPPEDPETAPTPAPEPTVAYVATKRGGRQQSMPGTTVHPQRYNARQAASRATGGIDGIDFFTMHTPPHVKPKGWVWKLAADVTPQERVVWVRSRKLGPKTMPRRADSPLNHPTLKASTITNVTPIRKDPMPTPEPLAIANEIVSNLAPTRDQRTLIHNELTRTYDNVEQQYLKDDSDHTLATRLGLPDAWVTDVRAMFFGDYDRNSHSEKTKREMDSTISIMKSATSRFLELAAEAETLTEQLVAARKLMGS